MIRIAVLAIAFCTYGLISAAPIDEGVAEYIQYWSAQYTLLPLEAIANGAEKVALRNGKPITYIISKANAEQAYKLFSSKGRELAIDAVKERAPRVYAFGQALIDVHNRMEADEFTKEPNPNEAYLRALASKYTALRKEVLGGNVDNTDLCPDLASVKLAKAFLCNSQQLTLKTFNELTLQAERDTTDIRVFNDERGLEAAEDLESKATRAGNVPSVIVEAGAYDFDIQPTFVLTLKAVRDAYEEYVQGQDYKIKC